MDIDVRKIQPDEVRAFRLALGAAFGQDEITDSYTPVWENAFEVDRLIGAYDGDAMVGTAGNNSFTMTIPGGELPTAGLTVVGVVPTHTRRGILRKLMRAQLDDARAHNEPLSILWASEEIIYQRFGYGPAVTQMNVHAERGHMALRPEPASDGRPRLVSGDEALKVLPDVYERVRIETPGMLVRRPEWWQYHRLMDPKEGREGGGKLMIVTWEEEGRLEGYALYRFKEEWDNAPGLSNSTVNVLETVATSPEATHGLWRYLFGIDLAQNVEAYFLPVDHPIRLMVLEPRRLKMRVNDSIWLRAVDVKGALANRAYAVEETLTFRLSDAFCEWNEGTWKLSARSGGHRVDATSDDPDLALDMCDIGAVYLGAHSFTELQRAGRVQQLKPGAIAKADAMFHTDRKPWNPEIF